MNIMEGKQGLVMGVRNRFSIAWAIAQTLSQAGATLALSYFGEREERQVRQLAPEVGAEAIFSCDVTQDEDIAALFAGLQETFGGLDFLVHSIAFAPRETFELRYHEASRAAYQIAHDVSAYSIIALARHARPLMLERADPAIVALSYYGAEKVVLGYKVMGVAKAALEGNIRYLAADLGPDGIRVNAISAGPMNTLSARGIPGFVEMRQKYESVAPLRRNVEPHELGNAGLFLLSSMSSGTTGEVLHVDAGYHILGMYE